MPFSTPKNGGLIFNSQAYFNDPKTTDLVTPKNPRLAAEYKALTKFSPIREKHAVALTKEILQTAIETIANGVREDQWTQDQKVAIQRLRTVKIDTTTQPPDTCQSPEGFPNAGYNGATHTLYLCTAILNVSDDQLTYTVGHELGHSVSPCMEESTLYKLDSSKLSHPDISNCDPGFFPNDETGETSLFYDDAVESLIGEKPAYAVGRRGVEFFAKLESCGIAKPVENSSAPQRKLFAKTAECLMHVYAPQYSRYVSDTSSRISISRQLPIDDVTKMVKSDVPQICTPVIEENFADSFSAKIISKIADMHRWTPNDYLAATLEIDGYSCNSAESAKIADWQYPPAAFRIKTILNDPRIADALKCETPKDPNLCPLELSTDSDAVGTSGAPSQTQPPPTAKPAGAIK